MIGGIKTKADGDYCAYCDNKIDPEKYNFCPVCGNPLNENGENLRHEQIVSEKIKLLSELTSSIKDPKALKAIQNKIKDI